MDWLSSLLDLVAVSGRLDIRCLYAAPWRLALCSFQPWEIPYHIGVKGAAVLQNPSGGPTQKIHSGDILILPHGRSHVLEDGSGLQPVKAYPEKSLNLVVDRNAGTGDPLDMLCGRFLVAQPYDRLLLDYLPDDLIIRAGDQ